MEGTFSSYSPSSSRLGNLAIPRSSCMILSCLPLVSFQMTIIRFFAVMNDIRRLARNAAVVADSLFLHSVIPFFKRENDVDVRRHPTLNGYGIGTLGSRTK